MTRATPTPKREDPALIKGQGCYADDAPLRDPLFVAFARSPVAYGHLRGIKTADAAAIVGVEGIYTGQDVAHLGDLSVNAVIPLVTRPDYPILALGHVGAVGQPYAAVLSAHLPQAQDAAELIWADIEETDAPNPVIAQESWGAGDVDNALKIAAHVVEAEITHPRLAPSPMEPRSIAIAYDAGALTIWHATQTPHRTRSELAAMLDIDPARIRVIAQHVGGAFGMKASLYPEEVFAVWAALQHKRDVRWTATRSDDFLSAIHGRGIAVRGQLGMDADGRFTALRATAEAPIGPWLPNSGLVPAWNAARILPSGYDITLVDTRTTATQGSLGPIGIYRGAGRPEANCLMERLVDKAARALGRDPIEIRRANLLPAEALPFETVTGNTLDSGDYAQALTLLAEKTGYAQLREACNARRAKGELVGIGIAFCVEPSGSGWESARVTWEAADKVTVASGSSSQGHGRETAYARIASDALGVAASDIAVTLGDTDTPPAGIGALASRATAIGGSAVLQACRDVAAQRAKGAPFPNTAEVRYENEGQAWGYGAYLVVLSVDPETGQPTIEQATCVDDAGVLIDPDQVHDQIIGGFAQGFGAAMMEQITYDADGQLLSGSFMDYAMPRAVDVPLLHLHETQTPSPMNLLGAKGVGEAGTIGAPAAILNAAIDALAPLGVTDLQMPLTAATLWQAMRDAKDS